MAESSKRKRDDSHERKVPLTKERRTKVRQEHMEEEFAATYHGLTALYKLLEVQHLQSPLFLPRTLGYRLDPGWQQDNKTKVKGELESVAKKTRAQAGATLQDFKIGMTSDTMEAFKKKQQRPGLRLSLFTANGKKFEENQFTLLATCLIPVPCSKGVSLPKEFLHLDADISVVAFQVVEISDIAESLSQKSSFSFAAPSAGETFAKVSGNDLLGKCTNGLSPLFGNILRLDAARRRVGYFTVELPAIASSVQGGVKCEFRMTWEPLPKTKKMQRLTSICQTKLGVDGEEVKDNGTFTLALPKRDITLSSASRKPCAGVWFHFLYHSMLRRMSEKRSEYSCAWCNMFAGSLRGLVAHLVSCHDRFRFQATLLDEFEDVSLEEKEFMKKWNRHVKEFKILADFMVASSCRMFARKHGKWCVLVVIAFTEDDE
ncbi:hypothetical protein JM18_000192 [Phytophthora kernoviae]|uniref:Polycomb protein SUZ12-like zinc finger domain-containing protein n=1 Tax=Phytophthora kernoviae TaxID=325452 RepID=A0A8T0MA45_9STRA|nr:hypothetical protein JM16_000161 [Phytophthora kernoviae]KAG2533360.1 hypothetical protein JM18_000192 [Phytophthora kernoviae]